MGFKKSTYDLIILGAGPAGLTAAIYAGRAKMAAAVIEENLPGGWMRMTHAVANYPGIFPKLKGRELARRMWEQAKQVNSVFYTSAEIRALELTGPAKQVELDAAETLTAPVIILAMGQEPRQLGLPGENEFRGRGISYCAICDGEGHQNKDVVVVGGGNSAMEEAIFLAQYARHVTVIHPLNDFQSSALTTEEAASHPKIRFLLCHEPRAYIGSKHLEGIEVQDLLTGRLRKIKAEGIFVNIGLTPKTALLRDMIRLDDKGYILTNELMHTNQAGVLAAGDIRAKVYRQITTAVADGTIAALEAEKFLRNLSRHTKKSLATRLS